MCSPPGDIYDHLRQKVAVLPFLILLILEAVVLFAEREQGFYFGFSLLHPISNAELLGYTAQSPCRRYWQYTKDTAWTDRKSQGPH